MPKRKPVKTILFSFCAIVLGLALVEAGARLYEHRHPAEPVDSRSPLPYQQLFEGDATKIVGQGANKKIVIQWVEWPFQTLPAQKEKDEIRIAVIGGSAAAGTGLPTISTFPKVMERTLHKAFPEKNIRVVNLSRIGYASPQIAHIANHVLPVIQPDLLIVIMGNNEYLDVAASTGNKPEKLKQLSKARSIEHHFAFARLMRPKQKQIEENEPSRPMFVKLEKTNTTRKYVKERLARSLKQMQKSIKDVGGQMLICSIAVNHRFSYDREWFFAKQGRDYPNEFRTAKWALTYGAPEIAVDQMRSRLEKNEDPAARLILGVALIQSGKNDEGTKKLDQLIADILNVSGDKNHNQQVMAAWATRESKGTEAAKTLISPWLASLSKKPIKQETLWQMGNLNFYTGDLPTARKLYARALDVDTRTHRATSEINVALKELAVKIGATFYDLEKEVIELSPGHIPGYEIFYDYCHYNPRGQVLIGHLLALQVKKIFKLKSELPDPEQALAKVHGMRVGRISDLPDLEYWAGADFDAPRLTDERAVVPELALVALQQYLKNHGQSAEGLTFLGNWQLSEPQSLEDALNSKAASSYQSALKLDPGFVPAIKNLEFASWTNRQ